MTQDGKDGILISAAIVVIAVVAVLLVAGTAPSRTGFQGSSGETCIYIINNSVATLLNGGSCNATLGKLNIRVLNNSEASMNITKMLRRNPVIIFDPDNRTLNHVTKALLGVAVHPERKPRSTLLYREHGNDYMLLLYNTTPRYMATYINLALKASGLYNRNTLLVPGMVAGEPVLTGLSFTEQNYKQPVTIVPEGGSYNETLDITFKSVLESCTGETGVMKLTVRVEQGGVLVDYQPTTSYAPLEFIVQGNLLLEANFTGVYLDESDYSQETAGWNIIIHPCWVHKAEVIPAYASIGILSEDSRVSIDVNMDAGRVSLVVMSG